MTARRQDIWLGALFGALGLAAATMASGYAGAAGIYPMALGLVMAALGAAIAIRAVVNGKDIARPLVENGPHVLITVACAGLYLALVPVLGFYLASILIALGLPVALGFRRPVYAVASALIFVAIVWLVFALALEKPLPAGFWAA